MVNVTPALLTLAEHHWYHHCQHNFQEEIQGLDFLFFLVSPQQPITELEANIHEVFAIFGLFLKENWSFKIILHYCSCNPLETQHSIQDLRKLEFDLVSFLLGSISIRNSFLLGLCAHLGELVMIQHQHEEDQWVKWYFTFNQRQQVMIIEMENKCSIARQVL